MRLAADDTKIKHGPTTVRLRPSLRAACILETRFSLLPLITGIGEFNLEIIEAILDTTAVDPVAARRLLIGKVDANGVRDLRHLVDPLCDLIYASYGIGDDPGEGYQAERQDQAGKRVSIIEALATLYQVATGWLGWPAEAALAATPAQIVAAHKGFIAKHKAINGVTDEAEDRPPFDPRNLPSDDEIADGVKRLKALARAT